MSQARDRVSTFGNIILHYDGFRSGRETPLETARPASARPGGPARPATPERPAPPPCFNKLNGVKNDIVYSSLPGPVEPGEDALIERLLDGLNLPATATPGEYEHPMADLRTVLAADYREAPGFPSNSLTHELIRVVENLITPYRHIWRCWQDRQNVHQLRKVFRWGDVVVNAQPYMQDTGLSLWGFSCAAKLDARNKFVIYLNTAHDPGAVAATIGHELGHYVYNAIGGGTCAEQAAMGNIFAAHLAQEEELFSDAVVALSAYSYPKVKQILGPGTRGAAAPPTQGLPARCGRRCRLSTRSIVSIWAATASPRRGGYGISP